MKLPSFDLDVLRSIPLIQKVGLLLMVLAGIIVGFYYYVAEPKSAEIAGLQGAIGTLDSEIQTLTIKVKHLDELIPASARPSPTATSRLAHPIRVILVIFMVNRQFSQMAFIAHCLAHIQDSVPYFF